MGSATTTASPADGTCRTSTLLKTVAMCMHDSVTRESEDLEDAAYKRTASPVLSQPSLPPPNVNQQRRNIAKSRRWTTTTGSLTVDRPKPRDPARSAVNGVADGSCHGARCIPLQHTPSTDDRQYLVAWPGRHPYLVNQTVFALCASTKSRYQPRLPPSRHPSDLVPAPSSNRPA
ncbi:hypothetical protein BXZ70DRAFT_1013364 [Cristinia sonorae]|uniref:Uncharacterized protein n=1 Tax=Cristinia sonorae TaxID=1940300 RepID=A0A8K0UD53_9AGAR|nr:hypothetical protein BXZ70DRAFT_1013364 [Cristinia sonorae]